METNIKVVFFFSFLAPTVPQTATVLMNSVWLKLQFQNLTVVFYLRDLQSFCLVSSQLTDFL